MLDKIKDGNSLFHSSLCRWKSLTLKSDCERLALFAFYKIVTVSKSLSSLFTNEWQMQIAL